MLPVSQDEPSRRPPYSPGSPPVTVPAVATGWMSSLSAPTGGMNGFAPAVRRASSTTSAAAGWLSVSVDPAAVTNTVATAAAIESRRPRRERASAACGRAARADWGNHRGPLDAFRSPDRGLSTGIDPLPATRSIDLTSHASTPPDSGEAGSSACRAATASSPALG